MMLPRSLPMLASLSILAGALCACGGGGSSSPSTNSANSSTGGSNASTPALTYPTSGNYLPVVPWVGNYAAGLSLLHPSTPSVRYVVEPVGGEVLASSVLYAGNVLDSTVSLQPSSLVFIQDGILHDLPLQANGSKPVAGFIDIGSTACSLPLHYVPSQAPLAAQQIVGTAGADGICGTADDGEVRVSMAQPFSASAVQNLGYRYLGYVLSGTVATPNVWVEADSVGHLYVDGGGTPQLLRATTGPVPTRVGGSDQLLLLQDGNQLSTVSYGASGWQVQAVAGTSGNWTLAGEDMNNFYVYKNDTPGNTGSNWQALAVAYGSGTATVLASGAGTVANATISNSKVYLSVLGSTNNFLYGANEDGSGASLIDTTATTVTDKVYTLGGNYQLLYRQQQSAEGTLSWQVNSLDGSGNILALYAGNALLVEDVVSATYPAGSIGLPQQISFITQPTGFTDYSGGKLETMSSSNGAVTVNGTLPTASAFGGTNVYWKPGYAFGSSATLFLGSVDVSDGTGFFGSPEAFELYNPTVANSLTQTTTTQ